MSVMRQQACDVSIEMWKATLIHPLSLRLLNPASPFLHFILLAVHHPVSSVCLCAAMAGQYAALCIASGVRTQELWSMFLTNMELDQVRAFVCSINIA